MHNDLPTLKGLRAFEEAYRHGSYTAAARSLNVQQPAISYQIKRLEEDLGVALFRKEANRLAPTEAARTLYRTLSGAFDAIRQEAERLRRQSDPAICTIATYPGIGTYWLSPRLPALTRALGGTVKVVTLVRDRDVLAEPADCRILFGRGGWPGLEARLLMTEAVTPVAAPDLAERLRADGTLPDDVEIIAQEDAENRWLTWDDWQAQSNGALSLPDRRMVVNDHGLALHMALTGAGITLGWLDVVGDLITGGSLVPLSDRIAHSDAGYWITARPGFFDSETGAALLDALQAHTGAQSSLRASSTSMIGMPSRIG
ncbi:MAG: LysR family transcriptional regulator [Silicimonas sp.]|nr:LysR family transcriptional regulator [Silicimonas sp.]